MKKRGLGEKPHLKKKGHVRVRPGGSGHGSTRRVDEVFTPAGLFPYPNQSSHRSTGSRVDPLGQFGFNNYDFQVSHM
jgi:hypothetical protein